MTFCQWIGSICSLEWRHRRVLNCHCLFICLMLNWQSSLHDGTRQQQVVDYDFNEALICFHLLRLLLLLTEIRGWGRYEGWREGKKVVGVGGSISSLGESQGLNDCRGADVCCSHIKQQLVRRNKLQGYWFTIHLLPSLLLPTFVHACVYVGIIYYTVLRFCGVFWWFFCMCVYMFHEQCVYTWKHTTLPISLSLSLSSCVYVCVCVCAFSKYTQWLPCAQLLI